MKMLPVLKTALHYCPVIGFMVVLSCLFFPYGAVQRIALIVTGITYVLDYVVSQRWKSWSWTREKWVYVVWILFFLLCPIWIITGIDSGPDLHVYVELYMAFAILGAVGLAGMPSPIKIEWFAMVALTTVSVVAIYIASQVGYEQLFIHLHTSFNPFNFYRAEYVTNHMHFNLFANMALVLGLAAMQQSSLHRVWRVLLGIGLAITITAIFISEGRAGLVTMFLIVGLSMIYYTWKKSKVAAVVVGIVGCVVIGTVGVNAISTRTTNLSQEPRHYIWAVACEQVKEHPWLGYGPATGHEQFVERGKQDADFMHYYAANLMALHPEMGEEIIRMAHPHNVFLETMIAYGILGVVLLVVMLILPVILANSTNRFLILLCELTYLIQGMFEKMGEALNPMLWLFILLLLFGISSTSAEQSAHPENVPC